LDPFSGNTPGAHWSEKQVVGPGGQDGDAQRLGSGTFVALGEEEHFELLGRESFGRVGVTLGSVPVVLPVNDHFTDGAIHFRTVRAPS
ncbi:MAG: hypothetical protein ACREDR_48280, partial [Blastocatellia bacterium]